MNHNEKYKEDWESRLDNLRQWLNEDRITDHKKMVTNKLLNHWLQLPYILLTAKQEGAESAVEYIKNSGYKIESVSGKMVGIEAHISILEQAKTAYKDGVAQ